MDTSAQSQVNRVPPCTSPPSPNVRFPAHQPSLLRVTGRQNQRGKIVKPFLGKRAVGSVFSFTSSSDSQSLPLGMIPHDTVKHEHTTKGDDECAITEDGDTSGWVHCGGGQHVDSKSSLTQELLGSNDAQPYVIMTPKETRMAVAAAELTEYLRIAICRERKDKNTTINVILKRRHIAGDGSEFGSYNPADYVPRDDYNCW
jgi:hypothetical protein